MFSIVILFLWQLNAKHIFPQILITVITNRMSLIFFLQKLVWNTFTPK